MSDRTIPDPSKHMDDPVKALYHAMGQEYQIVAGRLLAGETNFSVEIHTDNVTYLRDLVAGHFGRAVAFNAVQGTDRSTMQVLD